MNQVHSKPVAYGYGRHSTGKQGLTKKAQTFAVRRYFRYTLSDKAEWGGMHYDSATKGNKPFSEREYGRQLWAALKPGDHLIFKCVDRAFRSVADGAVTIKALQDRNVTIHIVDLSVDTSTAQGQFFINCLLAFAQLERDSTSTRTIEILRNLKENNLPYCRSSPMGWKTVGRKPNKRYIVDYNERAFIDVLAEFRENGMSQDWIARWCCRQKNYPTKRVFSDRTSVRWALMARAWGYPLVVGYKRLRTMEREGLLEEPPCVV